MNEKIAPSQYYIKCYPIFDTYFKSKYLSKIIGKLEFLFSLPKHRTTFYKFLEPCSHKRYKLGDSWIEQIGISRKVFNVAFKLIGTTYNSKSAFMRETDPFQGKYYVKYYDRKNNTMHFFRNDTLVEELFEQILPKANTKKTYQESTQPSENNDLHSQKGRSRKGSTGHSFISKEYIHNNLSSKGKNLVDQNIKFETEEKMRDIWIEETKDHSVSKITENIAYQLQTCWKYFGQSFDKWRKYCRTIASSKFLMGEKLTSNFKAWFTWIIKISTIEQIESGTYSLNDREVKGPDQTIELQQQADIIISEQSTSKNKLFHKYLLDQGGIQDYHRWFKYLTININDTGNVIIKTISNFMRDVVENRFRNLLKEAVYCVFAEDKSYKVTI